MEKLFGQKKVERDNAIVAAFKEGKSVTDLCTQFSVSRQVVNSAIFNSGIVRRNWCGHKLKFSALDQQGIARAYQSGKSVKEILMLYDISETNFYKILNKLGIKRRNKPLSDKQKKFICRYYRLGWSFEKIGEAVGAKTNTVANYISKQGLCNRNASRQNKELLMAPRRLDGTPDLRKVEPVADKIEEVAIMTTNRSEALTADYTPKKLTHPEFKISKIITVEGPCYRFEFSGESVSITPDGRDDCSVYSREYFIQIAREFASVADMMEAGEV